VLEAVGLFDEELVRNQDDELNLRLIRAGGRIWQTPSIRSWYQPRSSLGALFRQYKQYGYWKVRVIQKHRLPASIRHLVPAALVLGVVLVPLGGLFWSGALLVWGSLLCVYTSAVLLASVLAAARHGWSLLGVLPAVFVCYHFGYGIGFVRGIVDFLILRRGAGAGYTTLTRGFTPPG
jgi:FAD/FMN-containing dehydrogenase